jgi:DNA-binding protein HU-beta
MNKSDLVAEIASKSGLTKTDAEKALNAFIAAVTAGLKSGSKISVPGFLTLSKARREARTGRNPQTGASIQIAAKNVVKTKIGKTLEEAIN